MNNENILVVGAGISGLIAALELEKAGYQVIIIEQSGNVGGRLRTDLKGGLPLDHGFQVLLTAYPMAQKYLDYKALDLRYFRPGAVLHTPYGRLKLGDPLRDHTALLSTLSLKHSTISDKFKILRLQKELVNKSLTDIFNSVDMSTFEYLAKRGFSDRILSHFFKPFLSGIFLENKLETSSRMFQFVFKMFSEGSAAIPARGIQEIAHQLSGKLTRSQIEFEKTVVTIDDNEIILDNAERMPFDRLLLTVPLENSPNYREVSNYYFATASKSLEREILHLSSSQGKINNFHVLFEKLDDGRSVISTTMVGGNASEESIKKELEALTDINDLEFLHHYHIKKALPVVKDMKKESKPSSTYKQKVFHAGDYLLYPSLNAAMHSGELAAKRIIESL